MILRGQRLAFETTQSHPRDESASWTFRRSVVPFMCHFTGAGRSSWEERKGQQATISGKGNKQTCDAQEALTGKLTAEERITRTHT